MHRRAQPVETSITPGLLRGGRLLLALTAFAVPVLAHMIRPDPASAEDTGKSGKNWRFAVASIRRNNSGGPQHFGAPTPDGYQMKNSFLAGVIITAYIPTTPGTAIYSDDQIMGMPDWAYGDHNHYDIEGKVDDADLPDWQNPARQPEMMRGMLQALLADRLKLVAHRSTKEGPVYSLVVGKNGPKFKETNPAEPHPNAYSFPGGGLVAMEMRDTDVAAHYYGITIAQLTTFLLGSAGRPIQDNSGLPGKYDITIVKPVPPRSQEGGPQQPAPEDPELSAFSIAEQLGLKLQSARGTIETLVIDHIEKPSEN